ncbi:hypothetical protein [Nannocystis punicea]|uniref:Uncharacterized protein n=1 Tax=Nannocystis punicea TaxID=2995304 RepID=A0ABY7H1N9_9BACT|nr:hypothetical protein [Nannocystis poenicansa]WAS93181.1 hypothetical protein O0S08_44020 [Nannocystis poenicansa]
MPRELRCALVFALSFACGAEEVGGEVDEQCEIDGPTFITEQHAEGSGLEHPWPGLGVSEVSGRLFVTWAVSGRLLFTYTGLCGGPVSPLHPPELELDGLAITIDGDLETVYGIHWAEGVLYLLDRPETAEIDPPTPVASIPHEARVHSFSRGFVLASDGEPGTTADAAGVGGSREVLQVYDAARQEVVQVDDRVIKFDLLRDGDGLHAIMILRDDGRLRRYDLATGADETLAEDVRTYELSPGQGYLVWQRIGDAGVEATYLREVESGAEVHLTDNEFAAWVVGQTSVQQVGDWVWTEDDRFVGLRTPEDVLIRVYDTSTAAEVEVPEHWAARRGIAGEYQLRLGTKDAPREAVWDPGTGDVVVWFEGEPDGFSCCGGPAARSSIRSRTRGRRSFSCGRSIARPGRPH